MELTRMKLADLRPNPRNLRGDYGDLEAFADRLELTPGMPGEPMVPLIAVRDANVGRIVEGHRRYFAMKERGRVDECNVFLCETSGEADEVKMMLLANDREQLTEGDYAHGLQEMLALGVPEEDIDCMTSRKGAGRAVRRSVGKGAPDGQMTLDNIMYAAEVADAGGTEEDYLRVLEAKVNVQWERNKAINRIKEDREREALEGAIAQVIEAHGLQVADKKPKGADLRKSIYPSSMKADVVFQEGPTWAAAGCTLVRPKDRWSPWEVYEAAREMTAEEQQAVATKNELRRLRTAGEKRRAEWLHAQMVSRYGKLPAAVQQLVEDFYEENRSLSVKPFCEKAGADEGDVPLVATAWMAAAEWPYIDHLRSGDCDSVAEGELWDEGALEQHAKVLRAFRKDGYEPDEGELDFLSKVEHALAASRKAAD